MPTKSFLEELQSLEESTKTKVLIVSTIVLMLLVFYFWLAYFNGIVSSAGETAGVDQDQASVPVDQTSPTPGFWSRVGSGAAIVGDAIGSGFQWLMPLKSA